MGGCGQGEWGRGSGAGRVGGSGEGRGMGIVGVQVRRVRRMGEWEGLGQLGRGSEECRRRMLRRLRDGKLG